MELMKAFPIDGTAVTLKHPKGTRARVLRTSVFGPHPAFDSIRIIRAVTAKSNASGSNHRAAEAAVFLTIYKLL